MHLHLCLSQKDMPEQKVSFRDTSGIDWRPRNAKDDPILHCSNCCLPSLLLSHAASPVWTFLNFQTLDHVSSRWYKVCFQVQHLCVGSWRLKDSFQSDSDIKALFRIALLMQDLLISITSKESWHPTDHTSIAVPCLSQYQSLFTAGNKLARNNIQGVNVGFIPSLDGLASRTVLH